MKYVFQTEKNNRIFFSISTNSLETANEKIKKWWEANSIPPRPFPAGKIKVRVIHPNEKKKLRKIRRKEKNYKKHYGYIEV